MAAERAGASGAAGAMRVVDVVITIVLIVLSCLIGLGYGYLGLVATPVSGVAPGWVVLCVAMMLVPVATAILGIQRIRRGKVGFWMPLIGGVVVTGLIGMLAALSNSL